MTVRLPRAYAGVMSLMILSGCTNVPKDIVGTWMEVRRLDLRGEVFVSAHPVRELKIERDGSFSVSWTSFETYRDYWGALRQGSTGDSFVLSIVGGNHLPTRFDGEGSLVVDEQDMLRLKGINLGYPVEVSTNDATPSLYIFERLDVPMFLTEEDRY